MLIATHEARVLGSRQNQRGILKRSPTFQVSTLFSSTSWTDQALIIIIMYIYHALINAISAHIIHINLNMIFYTHAEHSPTKTIFETAGSFNHLASRLSFIFLSEEKVRNADLRTPKFDYVNSDGQSHGPKSICAVNRRFHLPFRR